MSISRIFLGWSEPCLRLSARYLADQFCSSGSIDLHHVIVALPVGRALRRLTELLVEEAKARNVRLIPPARMLTSGEVPELLYEPVLPVASDLIRILAWRRALQELSSAELFALTTSVPKSPDDRAWMGLAETMSGLWNTLAAGVVRFSEVSGKAEQLDLFEEEERWQVLSSVFTRYTAALSAAGYSDPQVNRIEALDRGQLSCDKTIVLIGASDLSPLLRSMSRACSSEVLSLVFAPQSYAGHFDDCGVLLKKRWADETVELADQHLLLGAGAESQARKTVAALASFDGAYSVEEISIGAGDPLLIPYLEQELRSAGVACRSAAGRALSETAPVKLLSAAARFASSQSFTALAALLRHTDFEILLRSTLGEQGSVLALLDDYQHRHLQGRINQALPKDQRSGMRVAEIAAAAQKLLAPLLGSRLVLSELPARVQEFLLAVYGGRELRGDHPSEREIIEVGEALGQELLLFIDLPQEFNVEMAPAEGLTLLLDRLAQAKTKPAPGSAAIEVLGWLELQLDDAPALVITGMHEGSVPEAINADPFLPDALRSALGLFDNEGRYARDLFAFTSICHSRAALRVVVGRRSVRGEPVLPGRILLACGEKQKLERILRLYGEGGTKDEDATAVRADVRTQSIFVIPARPKALTAPMTRLSVTAFADYIECPYRFYLRHVLGLSRQTDCMREMEPDVYGALVHSVLRRFGTSVVASSSDAKVIGEYLSAELKHEAEDLFGAHPLPAVVVQIRQLEARLARFAEVQAAHRAEGWEIAETEFDLGAKAEPFHIDGVPFVISGRIDRLDVKRQGTSESFAIIDYKIGEKGREPEEVHGGGKKAWKDLQLPLYYHLLRRWKGEEWQGEVRLGYALLPRDLGDTKFAFADWSEDDLIQAFEVAFEVIRQLRAEVFWPPSEKRIAFDPYAILLGANQFLADADEGGIEDGNNEDGSKEDAA